ncbi:hypothetical protein HKD21_09840 [Gluconobacter cerevisiae]|uniref:Transposase n=1 Tax=Gluconobacter cerevisiae TaxID=1379734 RepID=A0ABR9YES3_9PROT|nr:hypothetical protein [Gluconobacter cerevisiae]MBF0877149.1 hypothetical protein [Gluconobacter cerevisiae]
MMQSVFFDNAAWSIGESLIEDVRLKGKTTPRNLWRTMLAILWSHQNEAD